MGRIHYIKDGLCVAVGALGAFISACFGGWDAAMTTLMGCSGSISIRRA